MKSKSFLVKISLFALISIGATNFLVAKSSATTCGCSCAAICLGRCEATCDGCTVPQGIIVGAQCCTEAQNQGIEQGWLQECPAQ